ncbi:hypothetical protein [Plantibacter sp. CFBP 8775]|uniref:hypothetical protein n=1 Tax=Plantibacter sp. CFBP 8775 TaxID=2774038 RepID=UPI001783DF85|nr:hypothetical protein [Plantibacter sp. CFBP 8775]MBD8104766.1 hypothetical protein [Plantibacter sp. CFBP 8775]
MLEQAALGDETLWYLTQKEGLRKSDVQRWSPELWNQAAAVHAALSGPEWQMRLAADAPVPSWLIALADGHISAALDVPSPVLFRTAGLGQEWTGVPSSTLILQVRLHRRERGRMVLGALMSGITRLGGTVDADVYVSGDGYADGSIRAEVHAVMGVFPRKVELDEFAPFSTGFRVSSPVLLGGRRVSYTWTPCALPGQ